MNTKSVCLNMLGLACACAFGWPGRTAAQQDPPPPVYVAPAPTPAPAAPPAPQPVPPPAASSKSSAKALEELVTPIALHPDPLIAILLPAAVYPVEIVQAARFVKDTNNLTKVDAQPWDENVKAVAKFPALIAQMDADLTWTIKLGEAFLDQPKDLMDAIQTLRLKARSAGTLQNNAQQVVVVTNEIIQRTVEQQVIVVTNTVVQIQPANPQVVYVPTYPPTVYYPPPGYVYDPVAPLVTFGVGIAVGAIIANNCDWHGGGIYVGGGGFVAWGGSGDVDIDIDHNVDINRPDRPDRPDRGNRPGNTAANTGRQKWQPDQNRMRASGAGAPSAGTSDARGWSGGTTRPGTRPATPTAGAPAARPATGAAGTRPSPGPVSARPSPGATAPARPAAPAGGLSRPSATPAPARPSAPAGGGINRPSGGGGSAFGGVSSGTSSRNFGSRGAASRGGGGGGRGR